jgi:hypothetical protein
MPPLASFAAALYVYQTRTEYLSALACDAQRWPSATPQRYTTGEIVRIATGRPVLSAGAR